MNNQVLKPILEVNDLHIEFHAQNQIYQAVRGVSFQIQKGETVALVGESGCGKSALAQSIMKLIPMPPGKVTQGQILFQGEDLLSVSDKTLQNIRGKDISMIFQDSMASLNPTMRIGSQIKEIINRHQNLSSDVVHKKIIDLLNSVGIPMPERRMQQYPHEFSGGMRQRVSIAIAMACHPQLLIADEPTTALDVTIQAQILDLMRTMQKKMGMSILLITHDLGVVAGMCDRVMVMYAGKIIEEGTVDQIYSNPEHPYTHALLKSVPRLDSAKLDELDSIKGSPPDLSAPPLGCPFFARCPYAMEMCRNNMPSFFKSELDHYSACWLLDPRAKKEKQLFDQDKLAFKGKLSQ
ncbi:MAG: ABC transporter ATP-binding protein [Parachlamydiales bacterium]|nr:ABC transporter ATP-binding protein [Parachlamydiales bacterium]